MIAKVELTTTGTTAVSIIAKEAFMVTSLVRVYHQLFAVENEPALNVAAENGHGSALVMTFGVI
jgi:hypothetical protein